MTAEGELELDAEELAMLRQLFRSEAQDSLESVTARLLAAGSARPPPDALAEMLRVTHSLKGAAGTVGFGGMVDLSHHLESALVELRGDAEAWTPITAELLIEVIDGMRSYLDRVDEPGADAAARALRGQIDQLVGRSRAGTEPEPEAGPRAGPEPVPEPVTEELEPERPDMHDESDAAADLEPLPDAKPWLRVDPERIDALMSNAGELLFDRTRIERRVQLLRTLSRDLARTRQAVRNAIADEAAVQPPSRAPLVNAEAELAAQAALLSQTTAAMLEEIEALRGTIGDLQRGLTRMRMASARGLMAHAARTLRALRRATGVRVELRTLGEATEFDRAVSEQLIDPITQLLRNAVAHGVEPAAERAQRGKPPVATITVRALQDGGSLVLEVADDGRGIDTAALSERMVATGRWTASRAALASEADVLDALLDASISVRDEADELAGRGVGIGLVRQAVARLGGEVKVASVAGQGTTFTLRLPLSTTLAQAMLFKVDGQVYAIPSVHVIETTGVEPGATTATVHHDALPVVRLEQLLGHGPAGERRPGIVVSFGGRSLVCTVDRIVGSREIIIQPLGPLIAPLTLYAGATISGSGKVQLILDPAHLVRRAYPDARAAPPRLAAGAPATLATLAGRALVVDDSRAIREAMTTMLGSEGWIVDVAEHGARALQMTHQLPYDLVVTDLEMPELGGFDLIARLRQDDRFKSTPIIIITSRASPEHRRRAHALGVRALVAKPITRRKLLEALAAR